MSDRSSRSRDRSNSIETSRRKRKHTSRRSRTRRGESNSGADVLNNIMIRLNAIEGKLTAPASTPNARPTPEHHVPLPMVTDSAGGESGESVPTYTDNSVDKTVNVLSSLLLGRSTNYYISNFDPSVHDFDAWCTEVERGQELNRWNDHECLSRVAKCLKGDARTWLNDWVSDDRTWSNFKTEFRSLCPRSINVADILFDVMSTDSSGFATYAEYARKSLLRLNIVKGLSDDLKTSIVIRGIADPQVRAATFNAKLQPNALVEFLSVYSKPRIESNVNFKSTCGSNESRLKSRKHHSDSTTIAHKSGSG